MVWQTISSDLVWSKYRYCASSVYSNHVAYAIANRVIIVKYVYRIFLYVFTKGEKRTGLYRWLSARLLYSHFSLTGDIAVLHLTIDIKYFELPFRIDVVCTLSNWPIQFTKGYLKGVSFLMAAHSMDYPRTILFLCSACWLIDVLHCLTISS